MKAITYHTFVVIVYLVFTSCAPNQKKNEEELRNIAIQLEDKSIASGKRIDTLNRGYAFGMKKEDVYRQSLKLLERNEIGMYPDITVFYRFKTKNYILRNWVEFSYHKGKLWRIVESVLPTKNEPQNKTNADFIEDVLLDTKNKFWR